MRDSSALCATTLLRGQSQAAQEQRTELCLGPLDTHDQFLAGNRWHAPKCKFEAYMLQELFKCGQVNHKGWKSNLRSVP